VCSRKKPRIESAAVSGREYSDLQSESLATGLSLQTQRGVLTVEPWSDGIVHVRFGTAGYRGNYNPAVTAKPQAVAHRIVETRDAYVLSTKRLVVRVNKADANITFLLPGRKKLSCNRAEPTPILRQILDAAEDYSATSTPS
jgi:hypothetical protein